MTLTLCGVRKGPLRAKGVAAARFLLSTMADIRAGLRVCLWWMCYPKRDEIVIYKRPTSS